MSLYQNGSLKREKSRQKSKKKNTLKSVSKKESKNLRERARIYEEIDEERLKICSGCGQRSFLSHSHLISQKNKKFQSDKRNIVYDCMQREISDQFGSLGCHSRWESGSLEKIRTLTNWEYRMRFLKEEDPEKYERIFAKAF